MPSKSLMPIFEFEPRNPTYLTDLPERFNTKTGLEKWLIDWIDNHPGQDVGIFADHLFGSENSWDRIQMFVSNLPQGEVEGLFTVEWDAAGKVKLNVEDTTKVRAEILLVINAGDETYLTPVHKLICDQNLQVYLYVDKNQEGRVITVPRKNTFLLKQSTVLGGTAAITGIKITSQESLMINRLREPGDAYVYFQAVNNGGIIENKLKFVVLWLPVEYPWMDHLGLFVGPEEG